MPEIIHKVFVSSTYEDLREERAELQKALLRLNALPVGMELFPSANDETWDFIKEQIDDSDYYAVVVAGRYGSEYSDGLSFTEKEYDYARVSKKPVIAFLHADPDSIPVRKTDADPLKRQKLDKFIEKIRKSPVNLYKNPHDLAAQAITSFVRLRQRHPATGFIRVDQSIDPTKYIALLEENKQLKEQIAALSNRGEPFKEAEETLDFTFLGHAVIIETWANIFFVVAECIIDGGDTEFSITVHLVEYLSEKFNLPETIRNELDLSEIKKRLFQLRLIDLEKIIRPNTRGRSVVQHWLLTEYGKEQYSILARGR